MTDRPMPEITEMNRLFFEGTAAGELRIRHCPRCDERFRFSHEWCPNCWSLDLNWEKVSGRGTVSHFSIVYQAPAEVFETPYVLALIDLDEGVRMMSNIVGCDPETVAIGIRVEAEFMQVEGVTLAMFKPIDTAPPNAGEYASANG